MSELNIGVRMGAVVQRIDAPGYCRSCLALADETVRFFDGTDPDIQKATLFCVPCIRLALSEFKVTDPGVRALPRTMSSLRLEAENFRKLDRLL